MTYYQDYFLLPDAEMSPQMLMNILFSKLHKGLSSMKTQDVGVSFPHMTEGQFLGDLLRVHGAEQSLVNLNHIPWLGCISAYVRVSAITPVPDVVKGYCCMRRRQARSNPDLLRRRMMRRKGVSWEEAKEALPDTCIERLALPYVELSSTSTGKHFRLFIERQIVQHPQQGMFSCYGLSSNATVPCF